MVGILHDVGLSYDTRHEQKKKRMSNFDQRSSGTLKKGIQG